MTRERARYGQYEVDDTPIAKGGVGSIHRTDDPRFVWKRYFSIDKAPPAEHLDRLVAVGREVLVAQHKLPGQTPESSINWPVDVAVDGQNRVTGVLLPIIPTELFTPEHGKVRTLDFLVMRRAKPPTALSRVVLLLRMAEILAFVDSRGLIHGDINAKNLAWTVSGAAGPIMYLIDCDGMVPQEPPPARGVAAAGWVDPRLQEKKITAHDKYSDRYALALAMYRGLLLTVGNLARDADGKWAGPTAIPDDFPPPLADLLRRALGDPLNAEGRPAAQEWVDALVRVYLPNGQFDDARIAALDRANEKSAPKKDPKFVPIPQRSYDQTLPPVPIPNPPGGPTPWQPPAPPPPPNSQFIRQPPPNQHINQQQNLYRPPVGGYPTGRLALTAMQAGPKWYIVGVLAVVFVAIGAIIYTGIALIQLRKADINYPGVRKARISLIVFGSAATLWTLATFISTK